MWTERKNDGTKSNILEEPRREAPDRLLPPNSRRLYPSHSHPGQTTVRVQCQSECSPGVCSVKATRLGPKLGVP